MENRFIINVMYNQPISVKELGQIQLVLKSNTFAYEKYKDAKKAYDEFNRKGYIEFDTPTGNVTFQIALVEIFDNKKYEELEGNEKITDEHADDTEPNTQNELETE